MEQTVFFPNGNQIEEIVANNNALDLMLSENKIDLTRTSVSTPDGEIRVDRCNRVLRMVGNPNPVPAFVVPENIGLSGVRTAESEFTRIFTTLMNEYEEEENYITALRVHYGLDTASQDIVLFYEPVLLIQDKKIDLYNKLYSYKEKVLENTSFYYVNNAGQFVATTSANVDVYKLAYKNILIKHFSDTATVPTPFIQGVDTESALFSFQEIFNLISPDPTMTPISFQNAILPYPHDPYIEERHAIFISTPTGKYVNLAHLCPPNCKIVYKLL